jgi:hypothetical protein
MALPSSGLALQGPLYRAFFAFTLFVAWGCQTQAGAHAPTPAPPLQSDPAQSRISLLPKAPKAQTQAQARDDVVSLRVPFGRDAALRVMEAYFAAIASESNTELAGLLTEDATITYGPQGVPGSALVGWVRRFAQLEYRGLDAKALYRRAELELYSAEDASALAEQRGFAFQPSGDQLLVRVPLILPSLNVKGRFGNEVQMLLEPSDGTLRIRRVFEPGFAMQ